MINIETLPAKVMDILSTCNVGSLIKHLYICNILILSLKSWYMKQYIQTMTHKYITYLNSKLHMHLKTYGVSSPLYCNSYVHLCRKNMIHDEIIGRFTKGDTRLNHITRYLVCHFTSGSSELVLSVITDAISVAVLHGWMW